MVVRCAIYLRVSLDATGEQLTVSRHRDECRRLAENRGWEVIGEWVDNSISASDARKKRPSYDAMVQAYAAGAFDALLCWDLDRLTRQPRQLEDWVDAAEKRGLILVTANGEADLTTDGGRLYARIKIAVARGEIERKAARQRSAAKQRSDIGRPPLGVRLTGYTPSGELVPQEAAVVTQVFQRFVAGESLKGLTRYLTDQGIAPRHGRPWNPSSMVTMLKNPRYAGRAVYRGMVTGKRGGWEPLVDDETFDLAQAMLNAPGRRLQQGTERKHLGSGLYLCGVCGEKVSSWTGKRYHCPKGHLTRAMTNIDQLVRAVIEGYLATDSWKSVLPAAGSETAEAAKAELAKLRSRLSAIEEDYDAGRIDGRRYSTASDRVRGELAAAEAQLFRTSGSQGGVLSAADPVKAFRDASLMMQRVVVDALCSVRLYPAPRGSKRFDPATVQVEWRR